MNRYRIYEISKKKFQLQFLTYWPHYIYCPSRCNVLTNLESRMIKGEIIRTTTRLKIPRACAQSTIQRIFKHMFYFFAGMIKGTQCEVYN